MLLVFRYYKYVRYVTLTGFILLFMRNLIISMGIINLKQIQALFAFTSSVLQLIVSSFLGPEGDTAPATESSVPNGDSNGHPEATVDNPKPSDPVPAADPVADEVVEKKVSLNTS